MFELHTTQISGIFPANWGMDYATDPTHLLGEPETTSEPWYLFDDFIHLLVGAFFPHNNWVHHFSQKIGEKRDERCNLQATRIIQGGPPASYKWGYNFHKWGYNPSYPVIRPFIGVITPFITSRGPPCTLLRPYYWGLISCNGIVALRGGVFLLGGIPMIKGWNCFRGYA